MPPFLLMTLLNKVKDNKKVLFRNSQFLMALQFCSSTLLLTSTVQLLRAEEGEKGERKEHLTKGEPKKALGVIQSAYSARISHHLFAVLGYIVKVIFIITKTHTRDLTEKFSHAYKFKDSHTNNKSHIHKEL